ncbi:glucan endo-1,3-beta-glucosidase 1 [Tanacetum coccineum]
MAVFKLIALLLFIFPILSAALTEVKAQRDKDEPYVGVNIGTDVSNLLPPAKLVAFLQQQKVTHIRLYDADPDILKALSKTKIRVIVSVPNNQILGIGSSNTTAANWINRNVVAFYPDTLITTVAVGDEVLTTVPSLSVMLMPAIESLYSALVASNLHNQIKISTPHAANIILDPFPPSQAYFNETFSPVIVQLLRFLSRTSSPLMMNLYPYYVFMQNKGVVPLDNSLFKPLTPSKEMVDPNTLLHYTNALDAMIDSAYSSMKNLNVSDVIVLLQENCGEFLANDTINQTYCVATDGVDGKTLQTALDWAWGPGRDNCLEIQLGENCYQPNNVKNHASYAFDSYYEKQGRSAVISKINNAMKVVLHFCPWIKSLYSLKFALFGHGVCVFPGSKIIINRTNTVVNSTNATSGVAASRFIGTRPYEDGLHIFWGLILGFIFILFAL